MSRKGFRCPNCGSEFCSAIQWWKPQKVLVSGTWDAYKCHDCEQLTDPTTMEALPPDWSPPRKVVQSQPDLFGNVENIRDTIKHVPKVVEAFNGFSVTVNLVPEDSTEQYRQELNAMSREMTYKKTQRERPVWYQYRTIKRRNK